MIEQGSGALPEGGVPAKSGSSAEELAPAVLLQILSTEHWSLLATRSLSWNESFSRTSMFLSTVTGAVVALALAAQAMADDSFVLLALLLLPVVLFVGLATYSRLIAINVEDFQWVIGMNRLRHAYMELAPNLQQYFVSGVTDDPKGVMRTFAAIEGSRWSVFVHGFVTTPGMVAVINSVVAGVLTGLVVGVIGGGTTFAIVAGAVAFVGLLVALIAYQFRAYARSQATHVPRFPRPPG